MESLDGYDQEWFKQVAKFQEKGQVEVDGHSFHVNVELIMQATRMDNVSIKHNRYIQSTMKEFQTLEPREPFPKRIFSTYLIVDIPNPWNEVAKVLVKFSTLQGRYSNISRFHFLILEHFIGKMKVNLSFFFFHLLGDSIHRNRVCIPIHQGLIKILVNFSIKGAQRVTPLQMVFLVPHLRNYFPTTCISTT